jgi:hypothetical protein
MRRIRLRTALWCATVPVAGALGLVVVMTGQSAGAATRAIPVGHPMTASMTYYNDIGFGGCGTSINAFRYYRKATRP